MSKAILVLNEMPDGCANCALCRKESRKGYNDYICVPENQLAPMAIGTDRPDWCPLRPMPERDYSKYAESASCLYQSGWNDAIRAIEGSGEDADEERTN